MAAPHLGAGLSANLHFIGWICKLLIYEDYCFEFQVPNQKFYNDTDLIATNITAEEAAISYVKRLIGDNYHIAMRSGNDNTATDSMVKNIIHTIRDYIDEINTVIQSNGVQLEKIQHELTQLKNIVGLRDELKARINTLNNDIENIDGAVVKGKRDLSKKEQEIEALTLKLEQETKNLNKLNEEALELQKIITSQKLSKNEIEKLKTELSNAKDTLASIDFKKNVVKQSIPTLENEVLQRVK